MSVDDAWFLVMGIVLTAHDRPEGLVAGQLGQGLRARQVDKV